MSKHGSNGAKIAKLVNLPQIWSQSLLKNPQIANGVTWIAQNLPKASINELYRKMF